MSPRVLVIGLDCAPPALVFDRLERALPHLTALRRRGAFGPLRSVAPPITVPAWACMVSGRDPGELGLYGFRNRVPGNYALKIASTTDAPRVWDVASKAGKRVNVLYVPLTSPPPAVNGVAVSGFLGASLPEGTPFTHPPELGAQLEARFGRHAPDVEAFRVHDVEPLLDELYDNTRRRFEIGRALWRDRRPDLSMMVEMGTDRLHHALWRHLDPSHPDHDPADPRVRDARDYYSFVDAQVGAWLREVDDETTVLVVSDHGARSMLGGVCINQWLRERGLLVLREPTDGPTPLALDMIDWSRTQAWGTGGYYARIFLNVRGREPAGIVTDPARILSELMVALHDDDRLRARAHRPEQLYREVHGFPPDLLVFFGDLDYRSLGTVGGGIMACEDERGPDGCNHDWEGIFIAAGPAVRTSGLVTGHHLHDVGVTILEALGLEVPDGWLGRRIG